MELKIIITNSQYEFGDKCNVIVRTNFLLVTRPDALPLVGGIKASKHTTASSSSLLPFVHLRQCVTSGDSKNKQGEGEGGRGPLLVGTSRQLFPPC